MVLERSVHLSMAFGIVAYSAIGVCGRGLLKPKSQTLKSDTRPLHSSA